MLPRGLRQLLLGDLWVPAAELVPPVGCADRHWLLRGGGGGGCARAGCLPPQPHGAGARARRCISSLALRSAPSVGGAKGSCWGRRPAAAVGVVLWWYHLPAGHPPSASPTRRPSRSTRLGQPAGDRVEAVPGAVAARGRKERRFAHARTAVATSAPPTTSVNQCALVTSRADTHHGAGPRGTGSTSPAPRTGILPVGASTIAPRQSGTAIAVARRIGATEARTRRRMWIRALHAEPSPAVVTAYRQARRPGRRNSTGRTDRKRAASARPVPTTARTVSIRDRLEEVPDHVVRPDLQ